MLVDTSGPIQAGLWFDETRGRLLCSSWDPAALQFSLHLRNLSGAWEPISYTSSVGLLSIWVYLRDPKRDRNYCQFGTQQSGYLTSAFPAEYEAHRPGCTTAAAPELRLQEPWTRAWIGGTLSVHVAPAPQSLAVLATGFSDQSFGSSIFPFDLSAYGMPGCFVQSAPEHLQLGVGSPSGVTLDLAVPYLPALVGLSFWQQAYTFAPAANPAGLLASNSMQGRIGKSH